jgi:L,D-transpeptidase catalytic domain
VDALGLLTFKRRFRIGLAASGFAFGCSRGPLPFEEVGEDGKPVVMQLGPQQAAGAAEPELGSVSDHLPFVPTELRLGSIAHRTWVYTDTGPNRTRLGYLRSGAIVDARGPEIRNPGCDGGWLRINPRGFVCLGKGATLDLDHPVLKATARRPVRGVASPYPYAMSRKEGPYRYFRLPRADEMDQVEGKDDVAAGRLWAKREAESGLLLQYGLVEPTPEFLHEPLVKPYGVPLGLRTTVHAGRAPAASGFALLGIYLHQDRAFGLTTDVDLIPIDRTQLVREVSLKGLVFEPGDYQAAAFHFKGSITLWKRQPGGTFTVAGEQRDKKGYKLTGQEVDGLVETTEGVWLPRVALRVIGPRDSYPSVAVGARKWIDISIRSQTLVAYEGQRLVFATLVSTGRGEMGDPERDQATVRGTFMIFDKSISSTMDGTDDVSDSFDLRDVPFVQYFHKGFALHGAYWHDEFGKARSHGCVNLTPADAAHLFEWTDPKVPPGWHAALNKERGTVVIVGP